MRLGYVQVLLFFGVVALGAALLFPTDLDVAALYRNSYQYPEATALLERLAVSRPDDPRIVKEQAHIHYLAGRYEQAIALLERLSRSRPDDPQVWRMLGNSLRTVQDHRAAMPAYENLLAVAPTDSQALYLLEEYYRWYQQPQDRVRNLERIVAAYPQDLDSHEKVIDLYLRMGRGEAAAAAIQRASATFPDSARLQVDLGELYLAQRDVRALPVYRQLHARYPEDAGHLDGLVNALVIAGRGEEALERFDAFYASRLAAPEYLERQAQLFVYLSEYGRAIELLEHKLALAPTPDTRLRLIDLYARRQQYGKAVEQARTLVRDEPLRRDYWDLYVDYLGAAERPRELTTALLKYLQRWPADVAKECELVDSYLWQGAYRAALPLARRQLEAAPQDVRARARLAEALLGSGRAAAGGRLYAGLLEAYPDSSQYREGLRDAVESMAAGPAARELARRLYAVTGPGDAAAGLLYARLVDAGPFPDDALPVYAALTRKHAGSATVLTQIGFQHLDAGRSQPARTAFIAALRQQPDQAGALSGLAAVEYDISPAAALVPLQRLLTLRPGDVDVLYRLGLVHEAMGDSVAMRARYERMLERTAGVALESEYAYRRQAHALLLIQRQRQAEAVLERGRQRFPGSLELRLDHAEVRLVRGDPAGALDLLRGVPVL